MENGRPPPKRRTPGTVTRQFEVYQGDMDSERIEDLTVRAAEGDRGALEDLLHHYLPQLRAFVRLRSDPLLRRRESSSDTVQAICLDILSNAERFQYSDAEAFRRWLFTTAVRKLHDRRNYHHAERRDARRDMTAVDSATNRELLECYSGFCTPSRDASARERLEQVERAMETLSDEYREVISLARIAGLPHADVAIEMQRSEGTVRMLLHRALASLVSAVEKDQPPGLTPQQDRARKAQGGVAGPPSSFPLRNRTGWAFRRRRPESLWAEDHRRAR
jgi:RNA polymerase sigma-70 factor, ECF subfamily